MTDSSYLRMGLVSPEHRHLYQENAIFRSAVDALAQMLPFMVNGLAEQAQKEEKSLERLKEEAMRTAVAHFTVTPEKVVQNFPLHPMNPNRVDL